MYLPSYHSKESQSSPQSQSQKFNFITSLKCPLVVNSKEDAMRTSKLEGLSVDDQFPVRDSVYDEVKIEHAGTYQKGERIPLH